MKLLSFCFFVSSKRLEPPNTPTKWYASGASTYTTARQMRMESKIDGPRLITSLKNTKWQQWSPPLWRPLYSYWTRGKWWSLNRKALRSTRDVGSIPTQIREASWRMKLNKSCKTAVTVISKRIERHLQRTLCMIPPTLNLCHWRNLTLLRSRGMQTCPMTNTGQLPQQISWLLCFLWRPVLNIFCLHAET